MAGGNKKTFEIMTERRTRRTRRRRTRTRTRTRKRKRKTRKTAAATTPRTSTPLTTAAISAHLSVSFDAVSTPQRRIAAGAPLSSYAYPPTPGLLPVPARPAASSRPGPHPGLLLECLRCWGKRLVGHCVDRGGDHYPRGRSPAVSRD